MTVSLAGFRFSNDWIVGPCLDASLYEYHGALFTNFSQEKPSLPYWKLIDDVTTTPLPCALVDGVRMFGSVNDCWRALCEEFPVMLRFDPTLKVLSKGTKDWGLTEKRFFFVEQCIIKQCIIILYLLQKKINKILIDEVKKVWWGNKI